MNARADVRPVPDGPARWPVLVAVAVVVASVAGFRAGLWMELQSGRREEFGDQVALGVAFLAFAAVGAAIFARRPGHRIGWLFSVIGVYALVANAVWSYGEWAANSGRQAARISWLGNLFSWPLLLSLVIIFLPLLYPTGRPPTPRWWLVGVYGAAVVLGLTFTQWFQETICLAGDDVTGVCTLAVDNPIGVTGVVDPEQSPVGDVLFALAIPAVVAALASLVARFVRSDGVERLQLKWFTYAAGILFVYIMFEGVLLEDMLGIRAETEIPLAMAFAFLPISSGIAILRYRLYEIDRIISRTVSYGAVAGLLALVYVGGIVLIQSIVPASGSLAVAASTLAAAALFNPVRRRTLGLIDRRFNRSRYNAELEVQAFAGRLKSQMELEAVSADVTRVLARTLQPGSAGVWIRSHHSPV